jgi:hypothetical protein
MNFYEFVKLVHLVGFIIEKLVRMHGHTDIKFIYRISLFHRAFQFTMCNGPTNALVCNKILI